MKNPTISDLDKVQEANNLKPADMARLFNVLPQTYNNWRYRDSLPKAQFERALWIIDSLSGNSGKAQEAIELHATLSRLIEAGHGDLVKSQLQLVERLSVEKKE